MTKFIESLNISTSPYINAFIVIATFFIVALIFNFIIIKLLIKISKLTKSDFDDRLISTFKMPVFFTIILAGILYAFKGMFPTIHFEKITSQVIFSLIAIFWTIAAIKTTNVIIENAIYKLFDITGLRKDVLPLIENIVKFAIVVGAILIVFSIWNIDITPVLASAGIISAVIAFAAKDTIANFFGGISIFFDKPYKVGDYIELDEGRRGEVVEIGIRSTRIKTRDDILVSIPNSIIANTQIINESAPIKLFRIRVPIGVAYGSDIETVEKVLLQVAENNPNVVTDPEPRVRFRKFGESSLDFELLCWAENPAERGLTIHQLNCEIYKKFAEADIKIPFPQRDVHFKS